MIKTNCFYDVEATSVSRDADIISIGIIAVQNSKVVKSIYSEFTDFNLDKCDDWVKEDVVDKLKFKEYLQRKSNLLLNTSPHYFKTEINIELVGDTAYITEHLKQWLSQFESIEFWADFDVIDKPMLIDLIADWDYNIQHFDIMLTSNPGQFKAAYNHKVGLPKHLPNIRYDQFFDLHTLFKLKGIDTDTNREEFAYGYKEISYPAPEWLQGTGKHTALWDSYVSYLCYNKLISL